MVRKKKLMSITTIKNNLTAVIVVCSVVIVGTLWITLSHAATPTVSFAASAGTPAGCAIKVSDSTASSGTSVKFTSCASANDPTTLDVAGATIPDSNYTIPGGAIFMSPTGSDSNAGTQAAPVLTINKAVSLAPSSGTIVMRGGTYRDWSNSAGSYAGISKIVTIQAYPHEQPWFDGTDVIPTGNWVSDGAGHWSMVWNTPSFCSNNYYSLEYTNQTSSGPCAHNDMYFSQATNTVETAAGDPQMVYINGSQVHEVTTLAAATAGNFYYDWANKRIYIADNPSGKTIELSSRPVALIMTGAGSKILGIGFKRFASNEYNNTTEGAVYAAGSGMTIENSVFTLNAGGGLGLSGAFNDVLNHNVYAFNGFDGVEGNGHLHGMTSTGVDNVTLQNSVLNNNNSEAFGYFCTASCSQAGVKFSHMNGFTARNNIVTNNVNAHGIWCDLSCQDGIIVNNFVQNNGRSGIIYEVSDMGIIASNVLVGNGNFGIRLASANTEVYNNTLVNNLGNNQLWVYDDPRCLNCTDTSGHTWTDVGPDTQNDAIVNNVFYGTVAMARAQGTNTTGTNTTPDDTSPPFFSKVDFNAYYRVNGTGQVLWAWLAPIAPSGTYTYSVSSFSAAHSPFDANSKDVTSGGDPFFVNLAGGDYTIRSTSTAAYHNGTTIPANVVQALGLSGGTGYSRGAISWPN